MSDFKIDGPGFYRQRNGGNAEVFAERDGRWYGMSARYYAMSWKDDGTRCSLFTEYDLVARWPRFAVGDRVRVNDPASETLHGRYGVIDEKQHMTPGWHVVRLDDYKCTAGFSESELVPDDRPDPGPEHRLLGDDEILEAGDERQDGCDREPRRWLGPLTKCDVCIGKTVREVNAEFPALRILAWRRRLLNPAEPEQWVPTFDYAQQRCGFSDQGAALAFVGNEDGFKYVRHVRKWTCGDKSEWRPIPVEVPK